jgi:hypothetical protein
MTIIGIDPGVTGAIAWISDDRGVCIWDTPTLRTLDKKGKIRTLYDAVRMGGLLRDMKAREYCAYIEKVVAMPRMKDGKPMTMGATSMLGYGYGYGLWIMALTMLEIPYTEVHPATWKARAMMGMPKGKDADILRAQQLYPTADIKLKKHHGRADALLIAHYGMMIETNKPQF